MERTQFSSSHPHLARLFNNRHLKQLTLPPWHLGAFLLRPFAHAHMPLSPCRAYALTPRPSSVSTSSVSLARSIAHLAISHSSIVAPSYSQPCRLRPVSVHSRSVTSSPALMCGRLVGAHSSRMSPEGSAPGGLHLSTPLPLSSSTSPSRPSILVAFSIRTSRR